MADVYFKRTSVLGGDYWKLVALRNVLPNERAGLDLMCREYLVMSGDIGEPDQARKAMERTRKEMEADGHRLHYAGGTKARRVIEREVNENKAATARL